MGARAGTNRAIQQSEAQQAAPQEPPPPPTPSAPPPSGAASEAGDRIAQLKQLADLHASGALTDEEFAAEKAKILG